MLAGLIRWSVHQRVLVFLLTLLAVVAGGWAMWHTPLDALPDLSDPQVIVYTEFSGQAPQVVEDQVTFPLSSTLLAVPRSKTVRGFSFFGVSFVYVLFEEGVDIYWARSRVNEVLSAATARLPAGVVPQLGPDASGLGWVYQYALLGSRQTLAELRSLQDWQLRYWLGKTPGVAEVASLGGQVRQYQVILDPRRLQAYALSPERVIQAVRQGHRDVGGGVVELAETEFMVRGRGYLRRAADIGDIVLKSEQGTPVLLRDVAQIEIGPAERRGIGEWNGEGEAVSGIVVARHGQNALAVIDAVKTRLAELAPRLPEGVRIEPVYDRAQLIWRAIRNLQQTLLEEALIVAAVCVLFLWHVRSALVAILLLPVGVLLAFVGIHAVGMTSNIMSLGGIAIAIGAMVDAAIVMIENVHKRLERLPQLPADQAGADGEAAQRRAAVVAACQEVGPALFFSLCIITVSFLPVFALEAQEGRLFAPLAWTKSLAMAAAALLSVTLAPALMLSFVRGRIPREADNPLNRGLIRAYRPVLAAALRRPWPVLLGVVVLFVLSLWPLRQMGSEFMPTLNEGTILYMPTALPGMSLTTAGQLLQSQNRILRSFPEVASVYGKAGRAATATDPAPTEMFETVINLKPENDWRPGMTYKRLIAEMDQALQFPGVANAWTMPIKARIDMLSTGIRTPLGIKVFGRNLQDIEALAQQIEQVVRRVPGTGSAYAERIGAGHYLDIEPDRAALARHGVAMATMQETIATALGGEVLTEVVEGRERYGVALRYPRELRSDPRQIASQVLVPTAQGALLPLGQLARITPTRGAAAIRTENAMLAAYLYIDTQEADLGGYVARAQQAVQEQVHFPPGSHIVWSGQFESMQRAAARLTLVVPVTLLLIFLLLYLNFRRLDDSLLVMLSVPFALSGGIWLVWWLGYQLSVAVAVGFIALAGVAAETGVVMLLYLNHAWAERRQASGEAAVSRADLQAAIMSGAVERLRPKMMTVAAITAGLLPLLWRQGSGAEIMRHIAAPMIGGMLSSTLLTLLVIPLLYALLKGRGLPEGGRSA
ncbi:MAG: efflux RND transporter permease subunit [Sterolibacterium sp.]|nr:efflux RND transporter permease subunit [Sterolibacterium sp.]MBP9800536.1 efflux RND transporter permease subunit [Sterolibacterium sp.]